MKINRFEDIVSWKEARLLVADVYKLSCCNDRGFNGQIQRAAVSVMSNIAKGFERGSNREFTQYLIIARGSAAEVKSLAYAGLDIGYMNTDIFKTVSDRCTKIISLLNPNPQTCDRRTSGKGDSGDFLTPTPLRGVGITSVLSEFEKSTRYFPLRQELLPV